VSWREAISYCSLLFRERESDTSKVALSNRSRVCDGPSYLYRTVL
jgi:hypothetical protein